MTTSTIFVSSVQKEQAAEWRGGMCFIEDELIDKGVFVRSGTTSRGIHDLLARRGDIKGTKETYCGQRPEPSDGDSKGPERQ